MDNYKSTFKLEHFNLDTLKKLYKEYMYQKDTELKLQKLFPDYIVRVEYNNDSGGDYESWTLKNGSRVHFITYYYNSGDTEYFITSYLDGHKECYGATELDTFEEVVAQINKNNNEFDNLAAGHGTAG